MKDTTPQEWDMSANNYIKIYKEDMEYCVEERNMDTGKVIEDLGGWADLESAIRCANDFMEREEVEYGLDISFLKE